MDTIGSPETSVLNQLTPHNHPEDGRIQFNGGGSLQSPKSFNIFSIIILSCRLVAEEGASG
jgi:hypothetical protein